MDLSNEMTSSAARVLEDEAVVDSVGSTSAFEYVSFVDVNTTYPPSADIAVRYSVGTAVETSSRDWIGLYKVGWKTPKDYYTFEWAPPVDDESQNRVSSVVFQARRLPRDETNSFQFCYVTKAGEVRGVSTPFQVKTSVDDDLECIELQDENMQSVVLVNSRNFESQVEVYREQTALLESTMQRTKVEYAVLQEQLEAAETRVQLLESENETALEREKTTRERLVKVEKESDTRSCENDRRTAELTRELESVRELVAKLQAEIKDVRNAADQTAEKNQQLVLQAEITSQALEQSTREMQVQIDEEKKRVKFIVSALGAEVQEQEDVEEIVQARCDEMKVLRASLEELQEKLAVGQQCSALLTAKLSETQQQLSVKEGQLEAQSMEFEGRAADLAREIETLQGERSALQVQLEQVSEQLDRVQLTQQSSSSMVAESNLVELMGERAALLEELETARKRVLELEKDQSKPAAINDGAMFALRRAYEHAENQREELLREREALRQQLRVQRAQQATVQSLEAEANELRGKCQEYERRLELGAEAYKEKFLECRNLTKQLQQLTERESRSELSESEQVQQLTRQLADVQRELAQVEEQRSTLEKALVSQTEQRDEMQQQHEIRQAEADRKYAELAEELSDLRKEAEERKKAFEEQGRVLRGLLDQQEQRPVQPQPAVHDRGVPTPQYAMVPRDRATEETTAVPVLESGADPGAQTASIRSCPVCNVTFPRSKTQADFETHVNSHFDS